MLQLGIIDSDFPTIGKFNNGTCEVTRKTLSQATTWSDGSICGAAKDDGGICECRQKTVVPDCQKQLLFPCTPANNNRMRDWLLKCYASSTLNTCPHQQLPRMDGPPVEIHLREDAKPTATPVPMHCQEKVYFDLYHGEALGVIERVPISEPVTWCHRMVVTRNHDGSPCRTVDLSPLNKHCR